MWNYTADDRVCDTTWRLRWILNKVSFEGSERVSRKKSINHWNYWVAGLSKPQAKKQFKSHTMDCIHLYTKYLKAKSILHFKQFLTTTSQSRIANPQRTYLQIWNHIVVGWIYDYRLYIMLGKPPQFICSYCSLAHMKQTVSDYEVCLHAIPSVNKLPHNFFNFRSK